MRKVSNGGLSSLKLARGETPTKPTLTAVQKVDLAVKGGPGSGVYEREGSKGKDSTRPDPKDIISALGRSEANGLPVSSSTGKGKENFLHFPTADTDDDNSEVIGEALRAAGWKDQGETAPGWAQLDKGGKSVMVYFEGPPLIYMGGPKELKAHYDKATPKQRLTSAGNAEPPLYLDDSPAQSGKK